MPLEQVAGNRGSAEKLIWTEDLKMKFRKAQNLLKSMKQISYPIPSDQIITYSDFSQDSGSIGGRMEIIRTFSDGSVKKFHAGFSACLNPSQKRWQVCESESLGAKLVLEHFQPLFRNSEHEIIHYCDNLPTIMAYERAKQGKFSTSSRIATFLLSINSMNVKIVHKSGASLKLTDYISRHPVKCEAVRCQICQYVSDEVAIGEAVVNQLTVSDVLDGSLPMPYLQVSAWIALQNKDKVISNLKIEVGQKPEVKKTGGDYTILKSL